MFSEIYVFFKSIFLMYVQYSVVFVRILAVDVLHKTRRVVCNPKFLQNFHVIFVWSLIIFDKLPIDDSHGTFMYGVNSAEVERKFALRVLFGVSSARCSVECSYVSKQCHSTVETNKE